MAQDAVTAQVEIAKLLFQLARYRRAEFSRSSEEAGPRGGPTRVGDRDAGSRPGQATRRGAPFDTAPRVALELTRPALMNRPLPAIRTTVIGRGRRVSPGLLAVPDVLRPRAGHHHCRPGRIRPFLPAPGAMEACMSNVLRSDHPSSTPLL
jgi:hypothetical protein